MNKCAKLLTRIALATCMAVAWQGFSLPLAYATQSAAEIACERAARKANVAIPKTYRKEFERIDRRSFNDPRRLELQQNLQSGDLNYPEYASLRKSVKAELDQILKKYEQERDAVRKRMNADFHKVEKIRDACLVRAGKGKASGNKPAAAPATGAADQACQKLIVQFAGLTRELDYIEEGRYSGHTNLRPASVVRAELKRTKMKLVVCNKKRKTPAKAKPAGASGGGASAGKGASGASGGGSGSGSGAAGSNSGKHAKQQHHGVAGSGSGSGASGSGSGSGSGEAGHEPLLEDMRGNSFYSRTIRAPQQTARLVVDEDMAFPAHFQFTGWACGGGVDSFFQQAKAFIGNIDNKSQAKLERIYKAMKSGGDSFAVGGDPFHTALAFMQASGTPAQFDINPAMDVPAPGRKTIKNCYTAQEVAAMVKQLDEAITIAIVQQKMRF